MKIFISANEIVAKINHFLTEYSAIYPITPSSQMGEEYASLSEKINPKNNDIGIKNIFGNVPKVDVMQSETGAIASCHGALYGGAYSTTFSSSQGLLLMLPNMFKLASSLKPFVLNVASRSLSTHALNIFCDHSDIYSTLNTGFSFFCSSNVQSSQDFAIISHMLTLKSKIPVLHFFDGFITSHKQSVIESVSENDIKKLFPFKEFYEFKNSVLSSKNPKTLGTNQNPDIYFENRERIEEYVKSVPQILNECFDEFYKITNRKYNLFEYFGSKNATNVVISLGSSVETLKECLNFVDETNAVIGINLLNPFCMEEFLKVLPKSVKIVTVLDRAKQAGHNMEYLASTISSGLQNKSIKVLCGRYGLGGKDFDLLMAKAVFENMKTTQKNHFTVGIDDDISNSSLPLKNENFENNITKIAFFGVGSDGMVSASKFYANFIFEHLYPDCFVSQNSYYDSKKSGNITESQIFMSNKPFEINYKEKSFDLILISNIEILNSQNIFEKLNQNATVVLNATSEEIQNLNDYNKFLLSSKNCKIYLINATKMAEDYKIFGKTNLILTAGLFEITNNFKANEKLEKLRILISLSTKISKTNNDYLLNISSYCENFSYPQCWGNLSHVSPYNKQNFKVSNFKANGEMQNLNDFIPLSAKKAVWDENKCIKCMRCAQICPHNAISIKHASTKSLENAPDGFKFIKNENGTSFCLFIDKQKCTGCGNCINICPNNALFLQKYANFNENLKEYFENLESQENSKTQNLISHSKPYYSCNASCSGCMEISYFKILGSLFGSHLNLINATGCSSIYNGGVNCSPFKVDQNGYGTNFISSLFEDNAEFGFGLSTNYNLMRNNLINFIQSNFDNFSENFKQNLMIFSKNSQKISNILNQKTPNSCKNISENTPNLCENITQNSQKISENFSQNAPKLSENITQNSINLSENSINSQTNFKNFEVFQKIYENLKNEAPLNEFDQKVKQNIQFLIPQINFIVGGDGWAYDIDFGGLDHVISLNKNVNILILDNELYANTGGQTSKATNFGAKTKYTNEKQTFKKDLFLSLFQYKNLYFSKVNFAYNKNHCINSFIDAVNHNGPSIILAYSPCINHKFEMQNSFNHAKDATKCGYFNLITYKNAKLSQESTPNFELFENFIKSEGRYKNLSDEALEELLKSKKDEFEFYKKLSEILK